MREKSSWMQILIVSIVFALILIVVIRILIREPSPVISVASKTTHLNQLNQDTHDVAHSHRITSNYSVSSHPQSMPLVKPLETKLLPLPEKVQEPNTTVDPNEENIVTSWEPVSPFPGFSVRELKDGTTEFKSNEGKIYHVGLNEVFTVINGEPCILESGVQYRMEMYQLSKNGDVLEIDKETALWLRDLYLDLVVSAENALNEETREFYLEKIKLFQEEIGTVSGRTSGIIVTNELPR